MPGPPLAEQQGEAAQGCAPFLAVWLLPAMQQQTDKKSCVWICYCPPELLSGGDLAMTIAPSAELSTNEQKNYLSDQEMWIFSKTYKHAKQK